MTKSLGPFEYGHPLQKSPTSAGKRKAFGLAFNAFFPLLIVALAYITGRNFFGF